VSSSCAEMLENTIAGVPAAIMKRMMRHKGTNVSHKLYPPELRAFALTLQFYSTKAYNFVRKTFALALPHPGSLRRWYQSVDGEPGFTAEALSALKARVDQARKKNETIVCSLMMDEMAIKSHVEWVGSKLYGYVDMGTGVDDDSNPVAADVLVFMVVGVNQHWKIPVGYFLVNGLSGEERANLVRQCLMKLYDVGVNIVSLTCDGPSCHFSMMKELGAVIDPSNLKGWFVHPSNPLLNVHVIFDVCHMLKLVRNTLGDGGIIVDGQGDKIRWSYIVELQKLQDSEGFHLANKLRQTHIDFKTQKMKVNLAAQTLSSSVASAIEFCDKNLKLPQFSGSEATVAFIKLFDRLFDICNSRNAFSKGFKSSMRPFNEHVWGPFLKDCYQYISGLRDTAGQLMTAGRRKTAFIGFMVAIQSIQALYVKLVASPSGGMKYLLTYKFSQDHIELFFAAVRSSLGSNNNPTVRQFISAYKRLLIRNEVEGVGGNCIAVDQTRILFVTATATGSTSKQSVEVDSLDMALVRRYDLALRLPQQVSDHDYVDLSNDLNLSVYKQYVVSYIAGFVVRMVRRQVICPDCSGSLTTEQLYDERQLQLIKAKDKGGLLKPSPSVVAICETTEKCLQRMLIRNEGKLPQVAGTKFVPTICIIVLEEVGGKEIFSDLAEHMFDSTPDNNHVFTLIKVVCQCYCKIRMHALAKKCTEKNTGQKIRKKLSKLVLFKHQ